MSISKDDLLSRFEVVNKQVYIEAIDSEVVLKKLSINQKNEVNQIMFGANPTADKNGQFQVNPVDWSKAALKGVQYGLVEPKLKPSELSSLSDEAEEFLSEVFNAIQDLSNPKEKSKVITET